MSTTRALPQLRAVTIVLVLIAGIGMSTIGARADDQPTAGTTTVYTANQADDAVYGVDAATGAVAKKIPIGYANGIGPGLSELTAAPGGHVLYALSSGYGHLQYKGSLVAVNATDLRITGFALLPDGATSFVLSPNGATAYVVAGTEIEVVDLSTMKVTASIPAVAAGPSSVTPSEAISPDGSKLYVTDVDGSDLTEIGTATDAVTATVPAQAYESDVTLSPDGATAYVLGTNTATNPATQVVTAIATATGTVTATIPVSSGVLRLAASPNGREVYAWGPGAPIDVISTKSDTVTAIVALSETISWLTISSDSSKALATFDSGATSAEVVNLNTNAITSSLSLPGYRAQEALFSPGGGHDYVLAQGVVYLVDPTSGALEGSVVEGLGPQQSAEIGQPMLAIANQGKDVYAGNLGDTVSAVDVASKTLAGTARSAMHTPSAIAITADGQHAYVAGFDGSDVRLFDLATGTGVGAPIAVGAFPDAIALTPDGTRALVSNSMSSTVSVIDTATRAVTATIPVGEDPQQIVADGAGTAYVVTGAGLQELDLANDTAAGTVNTAGVVGGGLAISPDGSTIYVPVLKGVDIVNTATNTLTSTIKTPGDQNYGVAVSPDGSRLYITGGPLNIGVVYVIDLSTAAVVAHAPARGLAQALAVSPDGSQVYLASKFYPDLSVLGTSTDTITSTYKIGTGHARTMLGGIAVGEG